jgi:hypothetical protein
MPIFAIETMTSYVGRQRRAGEVHEARILEVQGPTPDGGRNRARFVFSAAVEPHRTAPVGYVTAAGATGLDLVGWLPHADFETYRDILDEGGQLQVHFETRDDETGYLRRLALGRANAVLVSAAPGEPVIDREHAPPRNEFAFAMPL